VVGQPGQRIERVAQHVAAGASSHFPAVDEGDAFHRLQRGCIQVLHRRAEHQALVPGVVGDQRQHRVLQARVIRLPVVGNFERRIGARDMLQDGRAGPRPACWWELARHLEGNLELDDQPDIVASADGGARTEHLVAQQAARHRVLEPHQVAHGRCRDRDLVARQRRAPLLHQLRHVGVLDPVGGIGIAGCQLAPQCGETFATRVLANQFRRCGVRRIRRRCHE
jgi:hypothetical protein